MSVGILTTLSSVVFILVHNYVPPHYTSQAKIVRYLLARKDILITDTYTADSLLKQIFLKNLFQMLDMLYYVMYSIM